MKKLLMTLALGATSFLYANVNAIVSILPQQTFLEKIGGDKVNVSLMVQPGNSPHSYEPKPSQMKDISKADVYFSIGVEFEDVWLPKFINQNKNMIISKMDDSITKIEIEKHSHHDHDEEKDDDHHEHHEHHEHHDEDEKHNDHEEHHDNKDPHTWLSPSNVKTMAHNIFKTLSTLDSKNSAYYQKNLDNFLSEINQLDLNIKNILKNTPKHSKFMVFHPSWGYFAKEYHLEQFAIESGGKNPKPKQIAYLIEEAKEENVKAIFTAPEFSTKTANQIAKEVGVPVIKISPLNPKWNENLLSFAKGISAQHK